MHYWDNSQSVSERPHRYIGTTLGISVLTCGHLLSCARVERYDVILLITTQAVMAKLTYNIYSVVVSIKDMILLVTFSFHLIHN